VGGAGASLELEGGPGGGAAVADDLRAAAAQRRLSIYSAPMAVERASSRTSLIDVLDRVLDKGIVIDAWVRVSLVGIDLIHPVEGRSSCCPSCIRR